MNRTTTISDFFKHTSALLLGALAMAAKRHAFDVLTF